MEKSERGKSFREGEGRCEGSGERAGGGSGGGDGVSARKWLCSGSGRWIV